MKSPAVSPTDIARFWARVERGDLFSCWNWTAKSERGGYGRLKVCGRNVSAHRFAAYTAGIIDALFASDGNRGTDLILHCCDNRLCCNPHHLRKGDAKDNAADLSIRERGSSTKLCAAKVTEIKQLYATTRISQRKIASRYGMSQRAICDAIRGVNWSHLTCP